MCVKFLHYLLKNFRFLAILGTALSWSTFISCYATTVHHLFGMHKFPLAKGISMLGSACGGVAVPVIAGWQFTTC